MKTLVNKNNPAIRITAPEIEISELFDSSKVYWIPSIHELCGSFYPDKWTLVEEEPTEGIKGNLEEIPSMDLEKKYIDADKLKAEIERHIKDVKDAEKRFTPNMGFFDVKLFGIYDVMSIVDSLQQEQPKGDLAENIEMEWDSFNKNVAEYGGESEDVVWLNWFSFTDIATYFYELGRKGGRK